MPSAPEYASRLRHVVTHAALTFVELSNEAVSARPAPGKWSIKEIVGHLVDSAANNHARFVRAPGKGDLVFDGYDQEAWVQTQQYQEADWGELVRLWKGYNLHLARVMESIPEDVRTRKHERHNLDAIAWKTVPKSEPTSLDYFMADYVGHLEHHLNQIQGILDSM